MMRKILGALLGAAATLAMVMAVAPVAQADDFDNLMSMQACGEEPSRSAFKFHIYYNSQQNGAWRNIGYSVYDFNALRPGDGHAHPLKFCSLGASNPWPGSLQNIKNNAASAENDHSSYWARVYFHSGYKGSQDAMAPYQQIGRFRNVYNENASFRWTS